MDTANRKDLIRRYKDNPPPAGIYVIRNTSSGRVLVGASPNVGGMLNRMKFQLEMGSHPDQELQADWKASGAAAFVIEELDRLEPSPESAGDPAKDLRVLKEMWIEKLAESGATFYPWTRADEKA